MSRKIYIIVDLKEVILEVSKRKGLYEFFSRFSLQEVIETIFSICPYIDYSDRDNGPVNFWIQELIGLKFEDEDIGLDSDLVNIFYETLAEDLDQAIVDVFKGRGTDVQIDRRYGVDVNKASYFFEKWIDNTSIMLRFED